MADGGGRARGFVVASLVVAAILAGVVSLYASSSPDGLEKVAQEEGFVDRARDHDLADSPVADYAVRGVEDDRLSTGLAGLAGVGLTFVLGVGLFALVRSRSSDGGGDRPAT